MLINLLKFAKIIWEIWRWSLKTYIQKKFSTTQARLGQLTLHVNFQVDGRINISSWTKNHQYHQGSLKISHDIMTPTCVKVVILHTLHQTSKLLSAIFYQIVVFNQMIALEKLWKCFSVDLKSSFCSRDIQIFVFPTSPLFLPASHCVKGCSKINLKF